MGFSLGYGGTHSLPSLNQFNNEYSRAFTLTYAVMKRTDRMFTEKHLVFFYIYVQAASSLHKKVTSF